MALRAPPRTAPPTRPPTSPPPPRLVAYAGVNPKTTNTDGGKELDSIIVAVGNEDANPVSLKVGTITVDKPVVTNWHTAPADAVPFN
ncbi:hypothetical protein STAN_4161 [Streptomyces sp. CBMAI 2042]|uniref:hypothetical protein n=1 Tax=Streptomyces sp. CBMAI 2042 TaxID=2305222 RepID=UPI000F15305B|nr:hypothetical protein STAN_4161 [Streptomyces sp. CBMAI 2042]